MSTRLACDVVGCSAQVHAPPHGLPFGWREQVWWEPQEERRFTLRTDLAEYTKVMASFLPPPPPAEPRRALICPAHAHELPLLAPED